MKIIKKAQYADKNVHDTTAFNAERKAIHYQPAFWSMEKVRYDFSRPAKVGVIKQTDKT